MVRLIDEFLERMDAQDLRLKKKESMNSWSGRMLKIREGNTKNRRILGADGRSRFAIERERIHPLQVFVDSFSFHRQKSPHRL